MGNEKRMALNRYDLYALVVGMDITAFLNSNYLAQYMVNEKKIALNLYDLYALVICFLCHAYTLLHVHVVYQRWVLSPGIIMLYHCSSAMTKDHFLLISYGTKWPLCVDVPLNTYSFIHSYEVHCKIHTENEYCITDIFTGILFSLFLRSQ